jgi:hypothetical protein
METDGREQDKGRVVATQLSQYPADPIMKKKHDVKT